MAEPRTRADRINALFPWLLHWSITDERIGGFRSDAYGVETADGLMLIDALPLEEHLEKTLAKAVSVLLTHGNHQRSAWRCRREIGVSVYAPVAQGGGGHRLPGRLLSDLHPRGRDGRVVLR